MIHAMFTDLTFSAPVLLAIRGGGSRRGADTGEILTYLGIAVVIIGGVCGLLYAANRHRQRQRFNSHSTLFNSLCQRHELDRAARRLLKQIASHHNLQYPSQVFIDSKLFDPNNLDATLRSQGLQVATLRNQLFGAASN